MDRLERLRRRIRTLDSALLALVAERMELAREVGETKRSRGVPLRDYEVEKRVLERAAHTAGELGVDADLARTVMKELIEGACRVQEDAHYSAYGGDAESILVVGGAGKMGGWLVRFFESQGHRVSVFDPAAGESASPLGAALAGTTMTFVAVPLATTGAVVDRITESGYRGVVCDVASVKSHFSDAVSRAREAGVSVTSIHPMFGPGVRTLSDRVIVVCDCGDAAATGRVTALFRETAATLVPLDFERHDRVASCVLGLSHLVNLVFASALAGSGFSRAELDAIGSTTFRSQMTTTESVVGENPDLYYSIQRLNPYHRQAHETLARTVRDYSSWIDSEDEDGFAAAMTAARAWTAGTA